MKRTRKTVAAFEALLSTEGRTSVQVERWFESGRWHARTVFGDVFGPEVESDSGVAVWFLAAARCFEDQS